MIRVKSFGTLGDETISNYEKELGFPIPEDYRNFIKNNNGGSVIDQLFFVEDLDQYIPADVFFGINIESRTFNLDFWLKEYKEELQENTLIIGCHPGGGLLTYITSGEDKGIYFWDHQHFFPQSSVDEGNTYYLADSFDEFADGLKDES
ncbi:SMI1/KNR4 family protein [Cytophagaceae bacterium ABcell3]|nr:SMI1/KNR4 family protein [Cytophagaceae bacterium ABcell3]